jgi:uncharacterized protein (TIGR03083 family)
MTDRVADILAVAMHELGAFATTVRSLEESGWGTATACQGWTVNDLACHVAAVAWQQGEAFQRSRLHIEEAPSFVRITAHASGASRAVDVAARHLSQALQTTDSDTDAAIPLPFSPVPLPVDISAQVLAIEYGVHRHDLDTALGNTTELHSEVATCVLGQVPGFFVLLAGADTAEHGGYRLVADTQEFVIGREGLTWQLDPENADPVCEVRGTDSAIALFLVGRLSTDDPALHVSDPALARQFKRIFPGP